MTESNYVHIEGEKTSIKAWIKGVPLEDSAREQLLNIAKMPFIYRHIAVMPDVHWGKGATIGSVIATTGAIIPAAVGVDLGCGMIAARTTLMAQDLPDDLKSLRSAIERAVPAGRTDNGGQNDRGAWGDKPPKEVDAAWANLIDGWSRLVSKHPGLEKGHVNHHAHLGTLGTGNHFIEVCLDDESRVWVMLHSGSRGVGNRIGTHFIDLAKKDMQKWFINLPDADLAYIPEGSKYFGDYVEAVHWAQDFARTNRGLMLSAVVKEVEKATHKVEVTEQVIACHHNYISRERHFGNDVWVTRKGAVSAKEGEMGIIPGSMGVGSYIVRGKGNRDSFHSCSHGSGRAMGRNEAKKRFTIEDHCKATEGIECRKDAEVIDETPGAYKELSAVIAAQADLIDPVYRLRPVVCVKG
jgi:tRNA-splicing ligase RtcB